MTFSGRCESVPALQQSCPGEFEIVSPVARNDIALPGIRLVAG